MGVAVANGASVLISGDYISNVAGPAISVATSASGGTVTILGNSLSGSTIGLQVSGSSTDTTAVDAEYNSINSNTSSGITDTGPAITAPNNWWGSFAFGPSAPNNTTTGPVTFSPPLGGPPAVGFGTSTSGYLGLGLTAPPPPTIGRGPGNESPTTTLYVSEVFQDTTGAASPSAGDIVTFTTGNSGPITGLIYGTNAFESLAAAVAEAVPGYTIVIGAETITTDSTIQITQPITIDGSVGTILQPQSSTTPWFEVDSGGSLALNSLTLDGLSAPAGSLTVGSAVAFLSGSLGGTISGVTFENISGFGVTSQVGGVTITNSVFSNMGLGGASFFGAGASSTFGPGITYTGQGSGGTGEVGVEVANGASVLISGNIIQDVAGPAISVETSPSGGTVTILGNTLSGNTIGLQVSGSSRETTAVDAEYNSITSNTSSGVTDTGPAITAPNNWWGSLFGPVSPNNTTTGPVTFSPPLNGPPAVGFGTSTSGYLGSIGGLMAPPLGPPPSRVPPPGEIPPIPAFTTTSPVVFGSGPGVAPTVSIQTSGMSPITFNPYPATFLGGVQVAVSSGTAGQLEIATAPGPGGGPNVKLFDQNGNLQGSLMAYDPSFTGGVYVALADVSAGGIPDIITGAGAGGGPEIRVFNGATLQPLVSFYAFASTFRGGVRVAVTADQSVPGLFEIVAAAGPGGGPEVRVFDLQGDLLRSFYAYNPSFSGGVYVAAGDTTGTGTFDIITSPGAGGGPEVRAFAPNGQVVQDYFAFSSTERDGAVVGASIPAEIIAATGAGETPSIEVLNFTDSQLYASPLDPNSQTGLSVAGLAAGSV